MLITKNLTSRAMPGPLKTAQEIRTEFGKWIRDYRLKAGMTQEAVAKKLGMHIIHIGKIEKGITGTKRDTIIAFAAAVGADRTKALEMYGLSAGEPSADPLDDFLFSGAEDLPPEKREQLRNLVMDVRASFIKREREQKEK